MLATELRWPGPFATTPKRCAKESDTEGDKAKATFLLEESLAISTELGMRPLRERALSRLDILKAG